MLRRPATTLTITAEDVAAYEDRRAHEAVLAAQQARAAEVAAHAQAQAQAQAQGQSKGQARPQTQTQGQTHSQAMEAMEGVQESPGQAARRAREERIGVSRRR